MSEQPGTILFVSHDASRTGGPIFLLRFLQWFKENKKIPFRILLGNYGDLVGDFEALGPVEFFEPRPTAFYKILRRLGLNLRIRSNHLELLRSRLAVQDFQLIYSNTVANGNILDFLSPRDCPVISHVHELEGLIHYFGAPNMRSIEKHTSTYIVVSEAVKKNLMIGHGVAANKIRMIYGFIPVTENAAINMVSAREKVFFELNIPVGSKLVCGCGAIDQKKGPDLFLALASQLTAMKRSVPIHFIWVGGTQEQLCSIREEIEASSLQAHVHFIGTRSNVTPYYDASDVFVLPSREDSFPLVMLEAALRRKPIVCFDKSGGAPEFVRGDAGVVVPGFDIPRMAESVATLLASPEVCIRLGDAGRQRVLANHDLNVGALKIAAIIEETMRLPEQSNKAYLVKTEHTAD